MATEKRITRLIRADVTVDAFTKWLTSTYDGRMPADIVNEIPTVDAVEVVHGQWEEWWPGITLIITGEEMLYRCSVCDAKYPDIEGYRYCPRCGADMRERKDNDKKDLSVSK
jgi:DNA-directed RNA polymerase subunit RPC12/RpoP